MSPNSLSDIFFMGAMGLTSSLFAPVLTLALRSSQARLFAGVPPKTTFFGFMALHAIVTITVANVMGHSLVIALWGLLLCGSVAYWAPVMRLDRPLGPAERSVYLFAACPLLDMAALYPASTGDDRGALAMIVSMTPLGLTGVWSILQWARWEESGGGASARAPGTHFPFVQSRPQALRGKQLAQVLLGVLWLMDGVLQLQPAMFGPTMWHQMLESGPPPAPGWLVPLDNLVVPVLDADAALFNVVFAVIQLAIGTGLLWRASARPALVASAAWASSVWLLGEAAGGLFSPGTTALVGAPGAALVYVIVSLLVWCSPDDGHDPAGALPSRQVRAFAGYLSWSMLWAGTALLEAEPAARRGQTLRGQLSSAAAGGPHWLVALSRWSAALAASHAGAAVLSMVLAQLAIAAAIWWPPARRASLLAGLALALAYGLLGQGFGGIFSGAATDPGTAAPMALLVVVLWPRGQSDVLPARVDTQPGQGRVPDRDGKPAWAAAFGTSVRPGTETGADVPRRGVVS